MGCRNSSHWQDKVVVFILAVTLSACGSGGGGSSSGSESSSGTNSGGSSSSGTIVPTPMQESINEGGNEGGTEGESTGQETEQPTESEENSGQVTQQQENEQQSLTVALTGTVTYDRVPFGSQRYSGLDYDAIYAAPARGVTVQILNGSSSVLASTQTDNNGTYQFDVAPEAQVRVRVLAELLNTSGAAWDVQVKDNTSGNAVYVLEGSLASVGANASQSRNIHAPSGWVVNSYAQSRSAAPFAILDSIYDALSLVAQADSAAVLPPLSVYWSVNNVAFSGSVSDGNIGTSYYTSAGPSIYLLGSANNDSDEYDRAVIQHEFGHYLEHQVGRTESIGGSHNQQSKLDMRVAFGEGWGNAFAGMVSGDPIYRDSLGSSQSFGYSVDVDEKAWGDHGWFSEASVQGVLYDLFDGGQEDDDAVSLGFSAIYNVFISEAYLDFDGMASIYSFVAQTKAQNASAATQIDTVMEGFEIYGDGWWGEGETNDGEVSFSLPIYKTLSPGDAQLICSDSASQEYNGFDVRQFVRLSLPTSRTYLITATRDSGVLVNTNPQLRVYQSGFVYTSATSNQNNSETISRAFSPGEYVLEVYEALNVDGNDSTGGQVCFNVSLG